MFNIQHAVWPTGVPPVSTGFWTQASWDSFAEGFRPEGYLGGIHDAEAWAKFDKKRRATWLKEQREDFYARHGMRWDEKAKRAFPV